VAHTAQAQLGWFVDACFQLLSDEELKITAMTRLDWSDMPKRLDKEKCDRILWELEDRPRDEVAEEFDVDVDVVKALERLQARS
jgi:hypothetical protein